MKKCKKKDVLKELFGILKDRPLNVEKIIKENKEDWARREKKIEEWYKK